MNESQFPPKRVGRPKSEAADSHDAILDAVYALLQETSVRQLTMEAVAKRAGVGKPTLYKWWPSKGALVFAMFHERMASTTPPTSTNLTFEEAIRARVVRLIAEFRGVFGKVMAELIAEGQSDPAVLQELFDRHIAIRRGQVVADIERAKANKELRSEVNAELLVDQIFGPIYYRLVLRLRPFDMAWGEALIDQVFAGARQPP
jgi:AcrR family transcriptional regulator